MPRSPWFALVMPSMDWLRSNTFPCWPHQTRHDGMLVRHAWCVSAAVQHAALMKFSIHGITADKLHKLGQQRLLAPPAYPTARPFLFGHQLSRENIRQADSFTRLLESDAQCVAGVVLLSDTPEDQRLAQAVGNWRKQSGLHHIVVQRDEAVPLDAITYRIRNVQCATRGFPFLTPALPQMLNLRQAAEHLGLKPTVLKSMLASGKLPQAYGRDRRDRRVFNQRQLDILQRALQAHAAAERWQMKIS